MKISAAVAVRNRTIEGKGGVQGSLVNGANLTQKQKRDQDLKKNLIEEIQLHFRHFDTPKTKEEFDRSHDKLDKKLNLSSLEEQLNLCNPGVYLKVVDDIALVNFLFATCKFGNVDQIKNVFSLFNTTRDDPRVKLMEVATGSNQNGSPH